MMHIDVLTPEQSLESLSSDYGDCTYFATATERICKNEIRGDKTMERILVGDKYSVRILLEERYAGPLLPVYRSAVMSVTLND